MTQHYTTADEMTQDRNKWGKYVKTNGNYIPLGVRRLAHALALSKPTTRQPFYDANFRQWQLTVAHVSDALADKIGYDRKRFYDECVK